MRNNNTFRIFLPLAGLTVGFLLNASLASAQQPEGPGQNGPRPGGQEDRRGPGGPEGQRPGGPGRPGLPPGVTRVPVVFSGGHDTDPRDGGRPVVLVANGLGVAPEVFREAFSHVRPARDGNGPTAEQAQQNKAALMNALGKYGIDNDRLDQVSNYYRYRRSRNELWTHTPAVANALIKNGVLVGFEIVRTGAGYSSAPTVTIPNLRTGTITVKLAFGKNLPTNGSIASITAGQN